MSAHAGIYHWDGEPVVALQLERLAAHSRNAALDGRVGTVRPIPGLALQTFPLPFDCLSKTERQPYAFANGSVLTWDGRLDNREDLLMVLHDELSGDLSDAALVTAAYQRWGADSLRRLVGDWSVVIWDVTNQSMVLASDYMGGRPLYYKELANGVAWATRLEALVACFDLYKHPDEHYIVGRLLRGVPTGVTPFHSVRALVAGHQLVANRTHGAVLRRYWRFEPATIRYRDPRAYTERLRELLTDAVRVRLRSTRSVWCHLSGGWDSSSVTCLAHRLLARQRADAPSLQPVSRVYRGEWADCDESTFIRTVETWCQLRTVEVPHEGFEPIERLLTRTLPGDTAAYVFDTLEAPMIEAGDHIILTGAYGDDVMIQHGAQAILLEALHGGHLLRFFRLCASRARDKQIPVPTLLARLVRETYLRDFEIGTIRPRVGPNIRLPERSPGWGATKQILERAPVPLLVPIPALADFPESKRPLVTFLYQLGKPQTFHWSGNPTVYRTHTYTHRPLVEFMLAAPGSAFQEPGLPPRAGMRRALLDILPPDILNRHKKGLAGSSLARSERDQVDQLDRLGHTDDWQLVKRGYLERATVIEAVARFRAEGASHLSFPTKWLYLEAWLQALTYRSHDRTDLRTSSSSPATSVHSHEYLAQHDARSSK